VSPTLAVVVMAYRDEGTVAEAVASLVGQEPAPDEVVLVTSGADQAAEVVRTRFPDVKVVETPERLLPGAARNIGVRSTSSDVVAFLAADCRADAGWVAHRRRAHGAGHPVVASAMVVPSGTVAFASYLTKFAHRLPTRPAGRLQWPDAGAHGTSYDRTVLDQLGGFDEQRRTAEDTEALARLHELGVPMHYEPAIRTWHREPDRLGALLRDQARRGRHLQRSTGSIPPDRKRSRVVVVWARTALPVLRTGWRHGRPLRRRIVLAAPAVGAATLAQVVARFREARA
jgi:GT2 family glycosyltransferase